MRHLSFAVLTVSFAASAWGQLASTTSLAGNVADARGAPMAGVSIHAVNQYVIATSAEGHYSIPFVKGQSGRSRRRHILATNYLHTNDDEQPPDPACREVALLNRG